MSDLIKATEEWHYQYMPYNQSEFNRAHGNAEEIPCFQVHSDEPDIDSWIVETNSELPAEIQEAHARLIASAPKLLKTLRSFFNIMHDYQSSLRKGYIQQILQQSAEVIIEATGIKP